MIDLFDWLSYLWDGLMIGLGWLPAEIKAFLGVLGLCVVCVVSVKFYIFIKDGVSPGG